MKDPYSGLYEVTEIHNLRDVIKKRLHEFPQNPVFLVKEKKGGEYIPISTEKYDHDIDSLGTYFMSKVLLPLQRAAIHRSARCLTQILLQTMRQ